MKLLLLALVFALQTSTSGEIGPAIGPSLEGPGSVASPVSASTNANLATYKLSGNRTVAPSSIHDDGTRTFIQWSPSQSMPAVFGIDEHGREQLVNGFMRDGFFTIDRVYGRLVFRIDNAAASARRTRDRK